MAVTRHAASYVDHIHSHGVTSLHVAATDESSIIVALHATVKADDRNALGLHAVNDLRYGTGFVGRHHQQVDATFHQTVNIMNLLLCIVV